MFIIDFYKLIVFVEFKKKYIVFYIYFVVNVFVKFLDFMSFK